MFIVNTRDQLLPDPQHDAVQLIFWCLQTEDCRIPSNGYQEGYYVGVIAIEEFDISKIGLTSNRKYSIIVILFERNIDSLQRDQYGLCSERRTNV